MQNFDSKSTDPEPQFDAAKQEQFTSAEIGPRINLMPELAQRLLVLSRICEDWLLNCPPDTDSSSTCSTSNDAEIIDQELKRLIMALAHVHLELKENVLPYSTIELIIEVDYLLQDWIEQELANRIIDASYSLTIHSDSTRSTVEDAGQAMYFASGLEDYFDNLRTVLAASKSEDLILPPELSRDLKVMLELCADAVALCLDEDEDDDEADQFEAEDDCSSEFISDSEDGSDYVPDEEQDSNDPEFGDQEDYMEVVTWKPEDSILAEMRTDLENSRLTKEHAGLLIDSDDEIIHALISTAYEKLSEAACAAAQSADPAAHRLGELKDLFDLYLQLKEGDLEESLLELA